MSGCNVLVVPAGDEDYPENWLNPQLSGSGAAELPDEQRTGLQALPQTGAFGPGLMGWQI